MAVRLTSAVFLAALLVAAVPALALPPSALHILEPDWCTASAYRRAEHAEGVGRITRESLRSAALLVAGHRGGCLAGMRHAHARHETFPTRAPWIRRGPHGDSCPRAPLHLQGRPGVQEAAEWAATAAEPRSALLVVVGFGGRMSQVRRACGAAAAARTVTVSLSLIGLLPSASLSERVVAVATFRGAGWRVYQVLH